MRIKIILLLILALPLFAQTDDQFWYFWNKPSTSAPIWVTSFPNTSSITPHNAYLRFTATTNPTGGQFARVFADASHQRGLALVAADIDSFKIRYDLKYFYKTGTAFMGMGNPAALAGWSLGFNRLAGNKFDFWCRGVQFAFTTRFLVFGIDDTIFHTDMITYNTYPGAAPYVLNAYVKVASGDSLTATLQDTIGILASDISTYMCFGNSGASTLTSDTDATKPVRPTDGAICGLKNVWVVKSKSGADTAYYYSLSEGYGDMMYPVVMTASSSLNAFRNFSVTDALSRGATTIQSFLDFDRAGTGSGVSLVAFNGGFFAYDRYDGVWWDSTTNTKITTASKPSYIDTLGRTGYSGVSNFSWNSNMGINAEAFALGGCIKDSFLFTGGGLVNNVNKTTVSGFGDTSFGIQSFNLNTGAFNKILSNTNFPMGTVQQVKVYNGDLIAGYGLKTGLNSSDSIKNVALTRYIARWDWDTASWKSIDSNLNEAVYMIYPSGNALMIGGGFTTAGATTLNYFGILRQPYGQWQSFGTGASNIVWAICVTATGDTVIGGIFDNFNGVGVNRICKWNGTTAVPYGAGLPASIIYTIQDYKGKLYAAGQFAGSTGNISYWDGATWNTAFGGVSFGVSAPDVAVIDMKIGKIFHNNVQVDSVLVVTGQFTKVGTTTCGRAFIYNGRDVIPCPWIDQRVEEAVCYNPPNSDTLKIYFIGDNYGVYGVSTQVVFGLNTTWTH